MLPFVRAEVRSGNNHYWRLRCRERLEHRVHLFRARVIAGKHEAELRRMGHVKCVADSRGAKKWGSGRDVVSRPVEFFCPLRIHNGNAARRGIEDLVPSHLPCYRQRNQQDCRGRDRCPEYEPEMPGFGQEYDQ